MQTSMSLSATLLKFRAVGQKQANNSKNMRQMYESTRLNWLLGLQRYIFPWYDMYPDTVVMIRYTIRDIKTKQGSCRGLRNKPSWKHAGVSLHSYWLPYTGLSLRAITHNSWAQWMLQALQFSCTFSLLANYYVCTITSYDWLKT